MPSVISGLLERAIRDSLVVAENALRATEIWKCIQNRLSPLSRYWWAFLLRVRQLLQLDQLQQHQNRVQQLRKVLAAIG